MLMKSEIKMRWSTLQNKMIFENTNENTNKIDKARLIMKKGTSKQC